MSILMATMLMQTALAASAPVVAREIPLTVPVVMIEVAGVTTVMDSHARMSQGALHVQYALPTTVPVELKDDTEGAVPMSVPQLSYDQPLVLENRRTGEVHTVEGVVEHKTPVMVVRDGSASARDAYRIGVPRNEAEPRAGVCDHAKNDEQGN